MSKIQPNGIYERFCGYTVIANVENDFRNIEEYIRKSVLSKYFSALPSSSYHITIYNIWANTNPLLKQQKNAVDNEPSHFFREKLQQQSKSIGFFNPNGCLDKLFRDIHILCQTNGWNQIQLVIDKIYYNGKTLGLTLYQTQDIQTMTNLRSKLIDTCGRNDCMGGYHITLGYKYRELNENEVHDAIKHLNSKLSKKVINISMPRLCSYEDMTFFQSYI